MTQINNTNLNITEVADHPAHRNLRVTYDLVTEKGDAALRQIVTETILIRAASCHDAPVKPTNDQLARIQHVYAATEGTVNRAIDHRFARQDLDVEQDWWSSAQDGTIVPIAEWADHLVADISIICNGKVQAEASTPVVSGSWGALGHD